MNNNSSSATSLFSPEKHPFETMPWRYLLIFTLQIVGAWFGGVSNFAFMHLLRKSGSNLDQNIRVLLFLATGCAIAILVFVLLRASNYIYVILHHNPLRSIDDNEYACLGAELLRKSLSVALAIAYFLISVERAVATAWHKKYEQQQLSNRCLIITCVIVVLGSAVMTATRPIVQLKWANWEFASSYAYCSIIGDMEKKNLLGSLLSFNAFELIALLIFVCTLYRCRKYLKKFARNEKYLDLASRAQLHRNVAITEMMLPSVVLNVLSYCTVNGVLIYMNLGDDSSLKGGYFTTEIGFYFVDTVALAINPLLCVCRHVVLKKMAMKWCFPYARRLRLIQPSSTEVHCTVEREIATIAETDIRFYELATSWERAYNETRGKKSTRCNECEIASETGQQQSCRTDVLYMCKYVEKSSIGFDEQRSNADGQHKLSVMEYKLELVSL